MGNLPSAADTAQRAFVALPDARGHARPASIRTDSCLLTHSSTGLRRKKRGSLVAFPTEIFLAKTSPFKVDRSRSLWVLPNRHKALEDTGKLGCFFQK